MTGLNPSGLQELFGRALLHKLTNDHSLHRHKHYRTRGAGGKSNPAGFKLLRKWLARSGKMFHAWEHATGKTALARFKEGTRQIVVQVDDKDDKRAIGWHEINHNAWSYRL